MSDHGRLHSAGVMVPWPASVKAAEEAAWARREAAIAPVREAWRAARRQADELYEALEAEALAASEAIAAPALERYNAVATTARADYEAAMKAAQAAAGKPRFREEG